MRAGVPGAAGAGVGAGAAGAGAGAGGGAGAAGVGAAGRIGLGLLVGRSWPWLWSPWAPELGPGRPGHCLGLVVAGCWSPSAGRRADRPGLCLVTGLGRVVRLIPGLPCRPRRAACRRRRSIGVQLVDRRQRDLGDVDLDAAGQLQLTRRGGPSRRSDAVVGLGLPRSASGRHGGLGRRVGVDLDGVVVGVEPDRGRRRTETGTGARQVRRVRVLHPRRPPRAWSPEAVLPTRTDGARRPGGRSRLDTAAGSRGRARCPGRRGDGRVAAAIARGPGGRRSGAAWRRRRSPTARRSRRVCRRRSLAWDRLPSSSAGPSPPLGSSGPSEIAPVWLSPATATSRRPARRPSARARRRGCAAATAASGAWSPGSAWAPARRRPASRAGSWRRRRP